MRNVHKRALQSSKNANFQNGSTLCRKAVARKFFRRMLANVKSFKLRTKHHDPPWVLCPGGTFLSLRRCIFWPQGSRFFLVSTIEFLVKFYIKMIRAGGWDPITNIEFLAFKDFLFIPNFHILWPNYFLDEDLTAKVRFFSKCFAWGIFRHQNLMNFNTFCGLESLKKVKILRGLKLNILVDKSEIFFTSLSHNWIPFKKNITLHYPFCFLDRFLIYPYFC